MFLSTINSQSATYVSNIYQVIVRMRPQNQDEGDGEMTVQKTSSDSLQINGQTFTFDAVADTGATQVPLL